MRVANRRWLSLTPVKITRPIIVSNEELNEPAGTVNSTAWAVV